MSPDPPSKPVRRIAIVGGGIAGIACSWKLREDKCIVDIYEADDRLGGHANSVPFDGDGQTPMVDTGFITMNEANYPRFNAFLGELGVETIPTDMSFGVSTTDGTIEWGSTSFWSFIGRPVHLFSPWFWRLIFDVVRFSYFARDILSENSYASEGVRPADSPCSRGDSSTEDLTEGEFESIGDYLRRQKYSDQFLRYFLIPTVAAPWCIDPEEFSRTFPAKPLIHFMSQRHLLDTVTRTLKWRAFRNGSRTYVDAFAKSLPPRHRFHPDNPIQRVSRCSDAKVSLEFSDGSLHKYDHVVLAVHANQALSLLGNEATDLERKILSCFKTSKNVCYLHSDSSLLPKRPSARVAWNCLLENHQAPKRHVFNFLGYGLMDDKPEDRKSSKISITFDMNKLQSIPSPWEEGSPGRVLVTMNPIRIPRSPQSSHVYHHPLLSSKSILALKHLHKINGVSNVSFAGAWMGWGFHEDGFVAGSRAAEMLIYGRDKAPDMELITVSEGSRPLTSIADLMARLAVAIIQRIL